MIDLPDVMRDSITSLALVDEVSSDWFEQMTSQWKRDTAFSSSALEMADHPAYRAVVAVGGSAIPLILRDLERNGPHHWFLALQELTGQNPVSPAEQGHMRRMAEAWITWGYERGFLSYTVCDLPALRLQNTTASPMRPERHTGGGAPLRTGLQEPSEDWVLSIYESASQSSATRSVATGSWSRDGRRLLFSPEMVSGNMLLGNWMTEAGPAS